MEIRTHARINRRLSGTPVRIEEGRAEVTLCTLPEMAADEEGLVHGGFLFSLADYAAMLAVNNPLVVLSAARVEFLRPVRVGEEVLAVAECVPGGGRRPEVDCIVYRQGGSEAVLRGSFECVVPSRHVLAPRDGEGEAS